MRMGQFMTSNLIIIIDIGQKSFNILINEPLRGVNTEKIARNFR